MTDAESKFADADSSFEDADFVIFGGGYDGTVSHRSGTRLAPASIRAESYNYETYLYEYDIELTSVSIHDSGDLEFAGNTKAALESAARYTKLLGVSGKFPVMLGGEHSLTVGAITGLLSLHPDASEAPFGVVVLDAHLDFRNEYEGERNSHACVTRRLSELLGTGSVVPIGIRSMSSEEHLEAQKAGLKYYDVNAVKEMGMQLLIEDVMELLGHRKIYLSVDMDALDPAYAPGVGNPEPFGLSDLYVRDCIEQLAPHLIGFDIMELSPEYDCGNTAALAARFVRSVIGLVDSKR
jgi:agmatinase